MSIEFADVGKDFAARGGGVAYRALEDVSLVVQPGEVLCLLGPSGCGKTTLLHMAAGFDLPSRGQVRVHGEPVVAPGPDRGVVFQSQEALFSWLTVEENVDYGLRMRKVPKAQRRSVVDANLELVGLSAHRGKFPRELSGGMKQRVQIARVLANDPRVLLMDEPFGALDAHTRSRMQVEIQEIWERANKTVIFVTHDVAEAVWLGDRIAVMTAGPAATVSLVVTNHLQRPRDKMTPVFVELHNELQAHMEAAIQQHGDAELAAGR